MRLTDIAAFSLKSLNERRMRSALTILMVVIGASLITALNGLNGGFDYFLNSQLNTLSPNLITITPVNPLQVQGFSFVQSVPKITLTVFTLNTLRGIDGVDEIIPNYRGGVKVISGGKAVETTLMGIDATKLHMIISNLEMEAGELIGSGDAVGIVLGSNVAHPPGQDQPLVTLGAVARVEFTLIEDNGGSQKLVTQRRSFVVKGIMKETGNLLYDNIAAVSPSSANTLLKKSSKFDAIYVLTQGGNANDYVESEIRKIYGNDIGVTTPKSIMRTVETVLAGFRIFVSSIGIVSLIVGAVGIVTTLFTAVMERTKEIGTLKAIGFSSRRILLVFLAESLLIGMVGGTLGIFGGIAAGNVLVSLARFGPGAPPISPVFTIQDMVSVWALSVGLSAIAGLYPAWRAARLPPVDALRQ